MLNIDEIQNGLVIDHIKAGTAIGLMDLLGIKDNRTASVALIQNARSRKSASGRKDIIKVEGDASWLNLDVLAYLDPDISVTVIENGKPVRKERPKPPKRNTQPFTVYRTPRLMYAGRPHPGQRNLPIAPHPDHQRSLPARPHLPAHIGRITARIGPKMPVSSVW